MEYVLENDLLKVTITSWGAQVKSVITKADGLERMWQADPAVWGYHAPILFPYAGRLKDCRLDAKGQSFAAPPKHGFARTTDHSLVCRTKDTLVLQITHTEHTLAVWPYRFRLLSAFTLDGNTLLHTLTVENQDEAKMPFGIGFHPAFTIPLDENHRAEDYELRFSQNESPLCLGMSPQGLVDGTCYSLGHNIRAIPIDSHLFDHDSHCMFNLQSQTLGLYEKDSTRAVVCTIAGFPYTLIWSKPGEPKFICIEPWMSLPCEETASHNWDEKPAAAILAPGENWSVSLSTQFLS